MQSEESPRIIEIDVIGQLCPSTLLIALENMNIHQKALKSGGVCLRIKTDNRDATETIPSTAGNMGFKVVVSKQSGYYNIEISSNN